MATASDLADRITALEQRIATFAGVKSTTFGDQTTAFDLEGAQAELARLRTELASTSSTPGRRRMAAFDKGV